MPSLLVQPGCFRLATSCPQVPSPCPAREELPDAPGEHARVREGPAGGVVLAAQLQERARRRRLRGDEAQTRLSGDLPNPTKDLRVDAVLRHDGVGQPQLLRLLGENQAAAVEKLA